MRRHLLVAALLLLFFSCNQGNHQNAKVPSDPSTTTANADSITMSPDEQANFQSASPGTPRNQPKQPHIPTPASNPDWDRKIVKTADLVIETKSFTRFTDRLHRLVRETGSYISQEEQTQSPSEIDNTVAIKVPVDRFEDLLQQLPADSDRLTDKKVTSQDVSLEYVDTKSHLETKKEVRERYLDLLKQAHKMGDIISIQQEIDGIQEEMDAAAGRINYLGHAAAFSTVNLRFFQVLDADAVDNATPTLLHRIKESFLQGWDVLSALGLGLLSVWPLWLAVALGLVAWRRHQNRTRRKPA